MVDWAHGFIARIDGWAQADARHHVGALAEERMLAANLPGLGMVKFAGVLIALLTANAMLLELVGVGLPHDFAVAAALLGLIAFLWRYYRHAGLERDSRAIAKGSDNG